MLVFAFIFVCPLNFTNINTDCALTAHKGHTYTSLAECQRDFVGYVVRPFRPGTKPQDGPPIIMKVDGQPHREANLLFMATCREAG